jgi:rhodanese-related sulfurtransferase
MAFASPPCMERISVEEVKRRLDRGEPLVVIDARRPDAWEQSDVQIPRSIRVAPDEADRFVAAIPSDATIVTYCT